MSETVRQVTVTFKGRTFTKDLTDDQILCDTCEGDGWVVREHPSIGPYVGLCPDCKFGVRRVCPHCKESIKQRPSLICECEGARLAQLRKRVEEILEKAKKAAKLTEAEAKASGVMAVYSDINDRYFSWDELADLEDEERDSLGIVWATTPRQLALDAAQVIEDACENQELHEGAFYSLDPNAVTELQDALNAWAAKYADRTTTYHADYKRLIVLSPTEEGEAEQNG